MNEPTPSDSATRPEAFYQALCERAAIALVATDAEMRIVCWNAAAEKILARPREQMLGQPLTEIAPEPRRKLLERLLGRIIRRQETAQFEITLAGENGRERALMVLLSPIPATQGSVQGVAAWIIDETRPKRLAEQLATAEKMASLGTLAAGVAHHFNNILGGVATFVDFALTSGDDASTRRALQMTAEAATRAGKITESLLSFAAKDLHGSDLADLTEVVLTFAHLVERPLAERSIQLHLDLHPVPVVPVQTRPLHRILQNLLHNAEEAMLDGGTLTLRLDQTDTDVVFTFADTGMGIAAKSLPLVFEPFFTTKGLLAGGDRTNPGLGLSVVHGLVTELGGKITAESEPGQYTRFCISLPIRPKTGPTTDE